LQRGCEWLRSLVANIILDAYANQECLCGTS
jgi:hypothetical protein